MLVANLKIAEDLFGLAVPRIVHVTERHRKARDRRRHRVERRTRVKQLLGLYVAARRRDPWGVFNLMPKTWPAKVSLIRDILGSSASDVK